MTRGPDHGHEHVLHVFERFGALLESVRQPFITRLARHPYDADIEAFADTLMTVHECRIDTAMLRASKIVAVAALKPVRAVPVSEGL